MDLLALPVPPSTSVTVNVTVYEPAPAHQWSGHNARTAVAVAEVPVVPNNRAVRAGGRGVRAYVERRRAAGRLSRELCKFG